MKNRAAIVIGIKGHKLTKIESDFLKEEKPIGVILFSRNIETKNQVQNLIKDMEMLIGSYTMFLIDQEGGRVSRLNNKNWPTFPSADNFGEISKTNIDQAKKLAFKNYKEIGKNLKELGINFNCAPVLDLKVKGASKVIGDRAFSRNPKIIADLGLSACEGLLSEGIVPILKHIPGHGRSKLDSHLELPEINHSAKYLIEDFYPFKILNYMPAAMIAHIKYNKLDENACATYSSVIINNYIKNQINFTGLLFSDDICMKALKGPYKKRSSKAINAGCDIVLHCNPKISDIYQSCKGAGLISKRLTDKINQIKKIHSI